MSQASTHQICDLAPATSMASEAVLLRCSSEKVSGFEQPGEGRGFADKVQGVARGHVKIICNPPKRVKKVVQST